VDSLFIIAVALIIAFAGVVAIAIGVLEERADRRVRGAPVDRGRLADEIQAWLKQQR
jgi:hypothetical protein